MELMEDIEPPEKRVLTWLSKQQTFPAYFESIVQNNNESPDVTARRAVKNCDRLTETSESKNSNAFKDSLYVKSGLNKYFVVDDSELSSLASDGEPLESSLSRKLFSYAEQKSIVQYIVEKKLFPFIKGNNIWKQMECERICARSWQSMKTHFHKHIYQHIDEFSLTEEDKNCFLKCMEQNSVKLALGSVLAGQRGWRKQCKFYTFPEDCVLMYYILGKKRYKLTHGIAIWKKLEQSKIVAGRSWQSMKSRYKTFLAKYVETFAPINKNDSRIFQRHINCVQKSEILQNYLMANLLDIAVLMKSIPSSNRSVKELVRLGLDCTFAIPLPNIIPSMCEKEVLEHCVSKIVVQLAEKIHMLLNLSGYHFKDIGDIINVLPPKYSSIAYFSVRNISNSMSGNVVINHGYGKTSMCDQHVVDKCDLPDSVKLPISPSVKDNKQLFQKSPKREVPQKSILMNAEKATSSSCVTSDTVNRTLSKQDRIFNHEMQSDVLNCQLCSETCVSDVPRSGSPDLSNNVLPICNYDGEFSSDMKNPNFSHFPSIVNEPEGKIVKCAELSVDMLNSFETQTHDGTSDPIRCEDNHNESLQREEVDNLLAGDIVKNKSRGLNVFTVSALEENEKCMDTCFNESFNKPTQSTSSYHECSSINDVINITPEFSKETNKEDKTPHNESGYCKLFDIPYESDKKCNKMYSSLLKCIMGTGGKTLRPIIENDSCSLIEYYISGEEESSSEITISASPNSSNSKSTGANLDYLIESEVEEEGVEQELRLQLGSEDSGSEI